MFSEGKGGNEMNRFVPRKACTLEFCTASSIPKIVGFPELKQQQEVSVQLEILPEFSHGEVRRYIASRRVVPSLNDDRGWEIATRENAISNERIGENYVKKDCSVYGFTANGGELKVTNFAIRVIEKLLRFDFRNTPPTVLYKIHVKKARGKSELITVKKSEGKNILAILQKHFPELFVSNKLSDATAQYVADVMDDAENGVEKVSERVEINYDGWFDEIGDLRYHLCSKKMPEICLMNPECVFCNGFGFLEIGRYSAEITVLFLYAHFAYLGYFFEKAGQPFQSVLFLRGMTGSLKTSVAKELANIFETNPKNLMMTFGSKEASIVEKLERMIDQLGLLDDLSNSEQCKSRLDKRLFERIVRILGDGSAPSKMGADGNLIQRFIRIAIIITGEDDPGLSLSSMLRCITLFINRDTFDGKILRRFQENRDTMCSYFALFIQFLEKNSLDIVETIKKRAVSYRAEFAGIIDAARLVDAAVNLMIVGDIVGWFSTYCGVENDLVTKKISMFRAEIIQIIKSNQVDRQALSVPDMYVIALTQSINTQNGMALATSEEEYSKNTGAFIGFEEKRRGLIFLDDKKAYETVHHYWRSLGQGFTASIRVVHQQLFEKKLLIKPEKGGGFLKRTNKGLRPYMLALDKNAIEKVLESGGDFS